MATREYQFIVGPETSVLPTIGSPSSGSDLVSLDFVRYVTGTVGTPIDIVAGTGITVNSKALEVIYIQGSGGAVDITANPQVATPVAPIDEGGELLLICVSGTNTVKLENGDGLILNGSFTMGLNDSIRLWFDGTNWRESTRTYGGA